MEGPSRGLLVRDLLLKDRAMTGTDVMEFVHEAFRDSGESYMNNIILATDVKDLRDSLIK